MKYVVTKTHKKSAPYGVRGVDDTTPAGKKLAESYAKKASSWKAGQSLRELHVFDSENAVEKFLRGPEPEEAKGKAKGN